MTPPVDGWVFAIGPLPAGVEEGKPLLEKLSDRFGKACFFVVQSVADTYGWAKAEAGVLQRWFIYSQGEVAEKFGAETAEEREIGLGRINNFEELIDLRELPDGIRRVDESDPHTLAHEWGRSILPLILNHIESDGVGIAGIFRG